MLHLSYNMISSLSLRGSIIILMLYMSHIMPIIIFGQISAIYILILSLSQIIGYSLSSLALSKIEQDINNNQNIIFSCIIWWLTISLSISMFMLLFYKFIQHSFFNNLVSLSIYIWGVLCLFGISLEIMANGIAIGHSKMAALAKAGAIQGLAMITIVPLSIYFFGIFGLFTIPVFSLISGSYVIYVSTRSSELSGIWKNWRSSLIQEFTETIWPSALAAIFLTALNIALINIASGQDNAEIKLAYFSISMQFISIINFPYQIMANYITSVAIKININNENDVIYYLIKSIVYSIFFTVIITIINNYIYSYYSPILSYKYLHIFSFINLIILISSSLGISQILTINYIIKFRQNRLSMITLLSTTIGIIYFILSDYKSDYNMLFSIFISNIFRIIMMLIDIVILKFRRAQHG